MNTTYGYLRVSTEKQNDDRQRIELLRFGIKEQHLFAEKTSGKDFNRPVWKKLCKTLKKGDVLVIKSLDRLGRNYHEIGEQWRYLTGEIGVDIKVLDMPLLDTGNQKDLLGTLISDLVLTLLSYVSEQERTFIRQRQKEGIAAAKARGVKFGRKEKPYPPDFERIYHLYTTHSLTGKQAATQLGITYHSFTWLARKQRALHAYVQAE